MNEELFKENLKRHEVTINKHNDEIDELKVANIESKAELKALCENLNSLTSMLKWLIGTMITTLVGFFIFAIQVKLF
ncbi:MULTISPECIES: hemolysin XhlA family protein [unclassified Clostridioides]|uniref:hemolysin XhlA family protein n=1 Tax=unclassified Clostridioides TaxID=2635829 RepID=UPI001D0FB6D4|nr:hemolysin XhlA family protein [Clostridioides sp. ES-S-0005-03]MCC0708172.1 hemolysin XhlA family protein [Clostridioides sp. ES-S-0190-01]UDN48757.1 hemolysin XhlA family protein [Clostridioides sp. ES-S-0173-01]